MRTRSTRAAQRLASPTLKQTDSISSSQKTVVLSPTLRQTDSITSSQTTVAVSPIARLEDVMSSSQSTVVLSQSPAPEIIHIADDSDDSLANLNFEPVVDPRCHYTEAQEPATDPVHVDEFLDFEQLIKYENLTVKQRAGHKRVVVTSTIPEPPSHQNELLKFLQNKTTPESSLKRPASEGPANGALTNGESHESRSLRSFRSDQKRGKPDSSQSPELPSHFVQTVNFSLTYAGGSDCHTASSSPFAYESDWNYWSTYSDNTTESSEKFHKLKNILKKDDDMSKDSHEFSKYIYGVHPSTNYRLPSMLQIRRNYVKELTSVDNKLTPKSTILSRRTYDKPISRDTKLLDQFVKPTSSFVDQVYQRNNCKNYKNSNCKLNKCHKSKTLDNADEEKFHTVDDKLKSASIDVTKYLSLTVPGMNNFEFFEVLPRNQQTSVVEIVHHISNNSNKGSSTTASGGDSSESSSSNSIESTTAQTRLETSGRAPPPTTPSPSTSSAVVKLDTNESSAPPRNVKLKNALIKSSPTVKLAAPVLTKTPNMKAITIANGSSSTVAPTTSTTTTITAGQNIILNNFKLCPPLKNLKTVPSGVIVSSPNPVGSTNNSVTISSASGSQQLLQILSTPPGKSFYI